jgi:hypothetical protein
MAISIDTRYWFEDSVARAWPPGADVFTGENNPKANYALDLNIDGKVMTFIPDSVINQGVYSPFNDIRVSGKSYYFPWFLDQQNQQKLAEVGQKVDLSDSDVGGYLKDQMGATTSGVLVPKGSIPFDSQIVDTPGKVLGIGNINGQSVYLNEDTQNTGRTYFTDPAGQTREYIAPDDGGLFGTGIGPNLGWTDFRDALETAGVIAGNYILPGSSLLSSQLVSKGAQENLATDVGRIANIGAGIAGSMPTDPNAVGGVTGPDNIDVGGGFNPAAPIAPELTGIDAALADLAKGTPAFTGTELATPVSADAITQQIATPAAEQIAAEQAAMQMTAEQFAAEQAAAAEAARIAAENAAYDQAMQDLAKNYVSPQFATSAAAQGLTFKQALDATRAGLLINALTGDPLGLSDVGGSAGNNFAESGFAQVPVPSDWKSPTYTYSPVQNVTFEDLFPGVSLQGTQWQNMPQAQTFNEMFASGQQTPMGSPVDINQIVGSILGQSATS